jgi:hypothetical protein
VIQKGWVSKDPALSLALIHPSTWRAIVVLVSVLTECTVPQRR